MLETHKTLYYLKSLQFQIAPNDGFTKLTLYPTTDSWNWCDGFAKSELQWMFFPVLWTYTLHCLTQIRGFQTELTSSHEQQLIKDERRVLLSNDECSGRIKPYTIWNHCSFKLHPMTDSQNMIQRQIHETVVECCGGFAKPALQWVSERSHMEC